MSNTTCVECGGQTPESGSFCKHCGIEIGKRTKTRAGYSDNVMLVAAKQASNTMMLEGLAWGVAGLVITAISYSAAVEGGTYYIFWGLSIYGGYRLLQGLYYRANPQELLNKQAEREEEEKHDIHVKRH